MVKNSKIDNDEINLIELIYTLWEGKWKVAVAMIISLIVVTSYQSIKIKNFTANTEIKPLSTLELNKFFEFNNMITNTGKITDTNTDTDTDTDIDADTDTLTNINERINQNPSGINIDGKINKITSLKLFDLYIDILNDRSVFEGAIRKSNLLDASQYNNEQEYSEAIIRLASSIKILSPPVSNKEKKEKLDTYYHSISFIYHDEKKWENVLTHVDKFTNELVKKTLVNEYNNVLLFLKNKRKHQLEDISIKINNHLIDYDRQVSDRVAYLKEQSAIAKKLGIEKNTIEVQTFGNQNALLSNVATDSPFYFRGYEAIDKEIELIQLRKNKKAFIQGLFELEKKKRAIIQDQTIERMRIAMKTELLADNNKFSAASINAITTKFEYNDYNNIYVLAIVIGLIAGIFYVLISNSFQSFRVSKKTN